MAAIVPQRSLIEAAMKVEEVLLLYKDLPEYSGIELDGVKKMSLFGDYPINVAATRGSVREMSALFNAGADLNASGEHGYKPLHNAVEQGNVDAVKWLLENGADKGLCNSSGETPADLAAILCENLIESILNAS
ncbi:ankyrin repeat domain-containing protein [Xanthomonas sacchari]|uniref:ankyrin repeat domain-containing protein n=1 Tax=Xanthomonas sacchari TaxID=56458 RepID=UPI002258D2DA|nr:ankyrin repeat domain-containing protein [Xanthomonas sacchari]